MEAIAVIEVEHDEPVSVKIFPRTQEGKDESMAYFISILDKYCPTAKHLGIALNNNQYRYNGYSVTYYEVF